MTIEHLDLTGQLLPIAIVGAGFSDPLVPNVFSECTAVPEIRRQAVQVADRLKAAFGEDDAAARADPQIVRGAG
jgi:hypothetical protein